MAEPQKTSSPTSMYVGAAVLIVIIVAALWFYSH
jgi:hypothetical protein